MALLEVKEVAVALLEVEGASLDPGGSQGDRAAAAIHSERDAHARVR